VPSSIKTVCEKPAVVSFCPIMPGYAEAEASLRYAVKKNPFGGKASRETPTLLKRPTTAPIFPEVTVGNPLVAPSHVIVVSQTEAVGIENDSNNA